MVVVVLNGDELLENTSYCYWIEKGRYKKSGTKYKYITRFVIVGISNIVLFRNTVNVYFHYFVASFCFLY